MVSLILASILLNFSN
ncbi:MAG: hypothetical protein LBJ80_03400 [Rickettsiales bacterium]|nr:hypothetical protein [Rickettsiales bacterium]MDR1261439.1 hypothetical protein [Rickettsiales bacterium]